jgi:hypothetical protein
MPIKQDQIFTNDTPWNYNDKYEKEYNENVLQS